MKIRTLAAVAVLLVVPACVEDSGPDPEACAAPTAEIELTVSADALTPTDPSACRDQEVTLIIDSSVDGVFHIHGYDAEVPATQVIDGQQMELQFTAARSGQFPIELHLQDAPEGVEIGVFTVHEP